MKYYMLIGNPKKSINAVMAFLVFLMINVIGATTSSAQGDLLLYPKRVLFEGSKRTQELNLANKGKDTARYVLSIVQIRMKEDGGFETITEPDPGQNFADKYFRIFPRSVVLPPNETQTVRIQLYNTGDLQPGEYRSHLYIRAEQEKKPLGEIDTTKDAKSIDIKLVAVFGISIPVIIRNGENTSAINISDVSFNMVKDSIPAMKITFNRSGNMSVYGDVAIDYVSPSGKTTQVGTAKGMAVYTPTAKRILTINLAQMPGVDYKKGSLHVSYHYNVSKAQRVAEESFVLR